MKLEDLVLAELEDKNLNGSKITSLLCEDESTNISFEINDMKIDFVATSETDFEVSALETAGQIFTDESTLDKCSDWARYVWAVVHPAIEKCQDELSEMALDELNDQTDEVEMGEELEMEASAELVEVTASQYEQGYKAALAKSVQEINDLKKRYHWILFFIIVISIVVIIVF